MTKVKTLVYQLKYTVIEKFNKNLFYKFCITLYYTILYNF